VFECAPTIDWSARVPTALIPTVRIEAGGAALQPGWVKDFVGGLGQSDDERNPNQKLRVTLPLTQKLGGGARKPTGDS